MHRVMHFKAEFSWSQESVHLIAVIAHVPWFVSPGVPSKIEIRKKIYALRSIQALGSEDHPPILLKSGKMNLIIEIRVLYSKV